MQACSYDRATQIYIIFYVNILNWKSDEAEPRITTDSNFWNPLGNLTTYKKTKLTKNNHFTKSTIYSLIRKNRTKVLLRVTRSRILLLSIPSLFFPEIYMQFVATRKQ